MLQQVMVIYTAEGQTSVLLLKHIGSRMIHTHVNPY